MPRWECSERGQMLLTPGRLLERAVTPVDRSRRLARALRAHDETTAPSADLVSAPLAVPTAEVSPTYDAGR